VQFGAQEVCHKEQKLAFWGVQNVFFLGGLVPFSVCESA
jgi:hypothetical protein